MGWDRRNKSGGNKRSSSQKRTLPTFLIITILLLGLLTTPWGSKNVSAALPDAEIEVKTTLTEPSGTGAWTATPDVFTGGTSVPSDWIGDEVNDHVTYTPGLAPSYTGVAVYGVGISHDFPTPYKGYIKSLVDIMLSEGMGILEETGGWPEYTLKLYYYEDGRTSETWEQRYGIVQTYYVGSFKHYIYYEPQSHLDIKQHYFKDTSTGNAWEYLIVLTYLYNDDDTKYTGGSAQLAREYLTGIPEFDKVESATDDCAAVIYLEREGIVFIVGHYQKDLAAVTAGIPSVRELLRKPDVYDIDHAPSVLSAYIFGENLESPPTPTIKRLEYKKGTATFKETGIVTGTPGSTVLAAWALATELYNFWSQYKAIQTYYEVCDLLKSMKIYARYVPAVVRGDADLNGVYEPAKDGAYIVEAAWGNLPPTVGADTNHDGVVDFWDLSGNTPGSDPLPVYGNADMDGDIDMADVTYIKLIIFGKKPATLYADANHDGRISMLDVTLTKLIIEQKAGQLTFVDLNGNVVTCSLPYDE